MGLETPTWINDLVTSNPTGSDGLSQGDNHLRNLKTALKNTLPNASKAFYFPGSMGSQVATVNVVAADMNKVIPVNAVGGAITVNLPANAGLPDGFQVWVIKTDSSVNVVTIDGNGADTINGQATVGITQQYQGWHLIWCTGISGWVGFRADSMSAVDGTSISFNANVLARMALTGAIAASAGSGVTTQTIDMLAILGDGINVLTTGVKGYIPFDFAATIVQWTLLADISGSVQLDIWKDTYANYPPTVADTITASAKPAISAATKNQSSTLTGWTTSIAAGDVLGINVDSAATLKQVTLGLKLTKTS